MDLLIIEVLFWFDLIWLTCSELIYVNFECIFIFNVWNAIFQIYICHQIEWIQMRTIQIKSMKTYQTKPKPMKSQINKLWKEIEECKNQVKLCNKYALLTETKNKQIWKCVTFSCIIECWLCRTKMFFKNQKRQPNEIEILYMCI